MPSVSPVDIEALRQYDTPTICNALEVVAPERRGHGFTVRPFSCLAPALPPIAGFARTAKIRAAAPDLGEAKTLADRIPYYEYVAKASGPTIIVIEDLDPLPGTGAFWGEVHTAVHLGLGALGAVTNGSYRDVDDSAPGFQILGGMTAPSHAFVRPVEFGCPVAIHGMEVSHDDIVHADRHGAVVIPAGAVKEIKSAIDLISRKEAKILAAARAKDFDIGALKAAIGESQDIH